MNAYTTGHLIGLQVDICNLRLLQALPSSCLLKRLGSYWLPNRKASGSVIDLQAAADRLGGGDTDLVRSRS